MGASSMICVGSSIFDVDLGLSLGSALVVGSSSVCVVLSLEDDAGQMQAVVVVCMVIVVVWVSASALAPSREAVDVVRYPCSKPVAVVV